MHHNPFSRAADWHAVETRPLTVTLITSAYSSGVRHDTTLGAFFRRLAQTPKNVTCDKTETGGFMPSELFDYSFPEPYIDKHGKLRRPSNRNNANIKRITLAVADFETTTDGFVPTIEHIREPLDARGIAYVIKSSFSHGLPGKGPRYRVIFPLYRPAEVEELESYSRLYLGLTQSWGWRHDHTCADAAQYYHDGFRHTHGAEPVCIFQPGGLPNGA